MKRKNDHTKYKDGYSCNGENPTYSAWRSMMSRCYTISHAAFDRYGGRGIIVCERWLDFLNFLADMGERPASYLSLDRIDNNGIYEPKNCRWATREQQQRNRRNAKLTEEDAYFIRHSSLSRLELSKRFGVWPQTISKIRLNQKWRHISAP